LAVGAAPAAAAPPSGFSETTAFSGLTNPTVVRFAPDGRVFVAEKSGLIKVFDGPGDTTASTFADLRTRVYNFWDRGLLGMTLDPDFSDNGFVYVNYAHDAAIGGTAPRWGTPGATSDPCPNPPGATGDGCVISGRISRLSSSGAETVLIEDYCQQYPSHSAGSLEHDSTGALWASAGEGASFNFPDYGQDGNPVNPCNDPGGANPAPPSAEGGALRSQDVRTPATAGDPTTLDGTVIRINDQTGAGVASNPLAGSSSANERRIVAYGLRNPFRFTISRQNELYVGDVGWYTWEEISRFPLNTSSAVNLGWPCYEGVNGTSARQPGYDSANLTLCENLYALGAGAVTAPLFAYDHGAPLGQGCEAGSSSIAGLEFYYSAAFPDSYEDALFFTDYSRDCIWVMRAGPDGRPNPASVTVFQPTAANPVFLEVGPDGALYYPDFDGGTIRKIAFTGTPVAVAEADPISGPVPLTVDFDGTESSDPNGDALTYAWDLDGDGQFDDSTAAQPSHQYTRAGTVEVGLRVTDPGGSGATDTIEVHPGNTAPVPTIGSPTASQRWRVGEQFRFSGSATDPQQGPLPASALDWELILHHCPSDCHTHPIQSWENTDGSKPDDNFSAPDHTYPSHLELKLTATDEHGLRGTTSVVLDPRTVQVTLQSSRRNTQLTLNGATKLAPFTSTVIEGSTNTISAPSPQFPPGYKLQFRSWSDGGAQTHSITANADATYTATMRMWAWPRRTAARRTVRRAQPSGGWRLAAR
jgi:glucose/arabinose dehydrogenase